ncbi:hypothetical protein HNR19_000955 [Nocardioides thalensis]|uniref:PD-(D/E)XK nuclease-like domain-containing protein n=1 Tax=Nocardioides thalensis TaxID=1914755 RepID=A0A853BZE8_9ACTN|nr:hypothetical protein [Nocardioides thalensis]NYJ00257.1 hypothetical protein [Nocardioides thalensis]
MESRPSGRHPWIYTRGDRSGFDIATHQVLGTGDSHLLTVEEKYIDTFSVKKVDYGRYQEHLAALGLSKGATDQLVADGCSQFLRSVMLTDSVRRRGVRGGSGIDHAMAVVLARADDMQARRVVDAIKGHDLPVSVDFWSHRTSLMRVRSKPRYPGGHNECDDGTSLSLGDLSPHRIIPPLSMRGPACA